MIFYFLIFHFFISDYFFFKIRYCKDYKFDKENSNIFDELHFGRKSMQNCSSGISSQFYDCYQSRTLRLLLVRKQGVKDYRNHIRTKEWFVARTSSDPGGAKNTPHRHPHCLRFESLPPFVSLASLNRNSRKEFKRNRSRDPRAKDQSTRQGTTRFFFRNHGKNPSQSLNQDQQNSRSGNSTFHHTPCMRYKQVTIKEAKPAC